MQSSIIVKMTKIRIVYANRSNMLQDSLSGYWQTVPFTSITPQLASLNVELRFAPQDAYISSDKE